MTIKDTKIDFLYLNEANMIEKESEQSQIFGTDLQWHKAIRLKRRVSYENYRTSYIGR